MTANSKDDSVVITIRNNHVPDCGPPPTIEADPGDDVYRGYFENAYGEQWVVEIDRDAKTGVLRGGDYGWDNPVSLHDSQVEDVILNAAEYAWLSACWYAATGEQLRNVAWEKMRETLAEQSVDGQ